MGKMPEAQNFLIPPRNSVFAEILSPVVDCQPLKIPDHGSISTNMLSQGTVVSVECETGYTLFGATTLQCNTDATWNNEEPTCKKGILNVSEVLHLF